jgi:hypothetical protein
MKKGESQNYINKPPGVRSGFNGSISGKINVSTKEKRRNKKKINETEERF